MKTYGCLVSCSTGLTRSNEDRGALLEGVHSFYSKIYLGESIRVTGQEGVSSDKISHCECRLPAVCFHQHWQECYCELCFMGRGLATELLLQKDGGKIGHT